MNNEKDALELTKENLLEGCYHEMGHVLASLITFPKDRKVQSIQFAFNHTNPYEEGFKTVYKLFQWNFPGQWDAFCLSNMGGGVFQQMKRLYNGLQNGSFRMNIVERIMSKSDPDKALLHFFIRKTKPQICGMEEDIKELRNYYWQCRDLGLQKGLLDMKRLKNNAVRTLFPYAKDPKIDAVCNSFCNEVLRKKNNGSVFHKLHVETILYDLDWPS